MVAEKIGENTDILDNIRYVSYEVTWFVAVRVDDVSVNTHNTT